MPEDADEPSDLVESPAEAAEIREDVAEADERAELDPPAPDGEPSPAWLAALDELAAREVGVRLPADAPWALAAVDAAANA